MAAWRLPWDAIVTASAADIAALKEAPALTSSPVLVKGSGPEVYVVDYAYNEAGEPGGDGGASLPGPGEDTGPAPSGGCATAGSANAGIVALLDFLGLAWHRRRRRLTRQR